MTTYFPAHPGLLLRRSFQRHHQRLHRAFAGGWKHLPFRLRQAAVAPILNRAFAEPLADGELEILRDRVLRLHITDAGLELDFSLVQGRLALVPEGGRSDVTIRGEVAGFLQLANREQDPDTLFFQRKLSIEGDTELGLHIKNLMDAVELEQLPALLRQSLALAGRCHHWLMRDTPV